jgi:adenylate cyclase
VVFPVTPAQTWITALVIGFAGVLGANVARVFRFVAWKASQEVVLERYVPQALTQEMLRSGDPERAGRLETISVLMADVRGFTARVERMRPEAAVRLLNDCFDAIVTPLLRAGGVLDKYVGDGLLAFFEGPNHAGRALVAARDMLAALDVFNATRDGADPVRIGIAIHAGETLVGSVGASGRRDYTVIGDVVNVTARLEECNKRLGSALVVSEHALALADGEPRGALAGPTRIDLRGRDAGIVVYHLAMRV